MSSERGHDHTDHGDDPRSGSGRPGDVSAKHGHDHDHHDTVDVDGHHHDHGDGHRHEHGAGWRQWGHRLGHLLTPHSHDTADKIDSVMESSREGIRALWTSLLGLGITALLQLLVYLWSGSVALLGDTLHNLADALTAIPLRVAFLLGRRAATRRYTYGFGRAEEPHSSGSPATNWLPGTASPSASVTAVQYKAGACGVGPSCTS